MSESQMIYGIKPVIEAIQSNKPIDRLLISTSIKGASVTELRKLIRKNKIPNQNVHQDKLQKITDGNHQGIIAYISNYETYELSEILPSILEEENPIILILDRITDVRNFGAICRTAECAGVKTIVVPRKKSAQIGGDAMKTSAGALNHIKVCKELRLIDTLTLLQQNGVHVVACTEKTAVSYTDVNFKQPTAIIMGNEEKGIASDLLKIADKTAKIPLLGNITSLNVSTAASVILYEAIRQQNS